jgi:hypothetical protein
LLVKIGKMSTQKCIVGATVFTPVAATAENATFVGTANVASSMACSPLRSLGLVGTGKEISYDWPAVSHGSPPPGFDKVTVMRTGS